MRKFRSPQHRQQLALLPRSIDEYVARDDSVRFLDVLIDEFDLSSIEDEYSNQGRPAYSPRVLTKVLLYGKIRGVRSSRELARACKENLRFIFLAQDEKPDFRTISDFRKRFLPQLGELLKETVEIGIEEGFINLEHVAIDGTKLRANASAKSFQSKEKLEEVLKELEQSLIEDIKRDSQSESDSEDNNDEDPKLPQELLKLENLVERTRSALKKMGEKKRISLTDSDANFMESQAGCHPSYNGQIAVDEKSQMIVGAQISTAGSDHGELKGMLEEVKATTGSDPKRVSADKGYRANEGLVELQERKIEGFVSLQESKQAAIPASEFKYQQEEDEYECPTGELLVLIGKKHGRDASIYQSEDCSGCPISTDCIGGKAKVRTLVVSHHEEIVSAMREKMETEEGKQMLKARSKTVEPVFAWLKVHRCFRQFSVRGQTAVNNMWRFEAAAINVFRLITERMKFAKLVAS